MCQRLELTKENLHLLSKHVSVKVLVFVLHFRGSTKLEPSQKICFENWQAVATELKGVELEKRKYQRLELTKEKIKFALKARVCQCFGVCIAFTQFN